MSTFEGATYNIADDDIYIRLNIANVHSNNWIMKKIISLTGWYSWKKHDLGQVIFFAICTKRIYLIAGLKGIDGGRVLMSYPKNPTDLPQPESNQILVSVPRILKPKQEEKEKNVLQKKRVFEVNFVGNEMALMNIMDKFR